MPTQGVTQEKAQEILGKDFSTIEDALRLFPALNYPKKYRANMATVPFSTDFLRSRKGSLVVCPGFNRLGNDILSLRTLDGMFFDRSMPRISHHNKHIPHISHDNTNRLKTTENCPERSLWFWSGSEDFFSGTAELRWYAISKVSKNPHKHISIFEQNDIMEREGGRKRENAFVYTWAAWLHFLRTGELLWPGISIWTSDVLPDRRRVAVGGWEDPTKPIWVLELSDPNMNRFPKTVPSYEPNFHQAD
jgi:hypothetical protein